MANEFVIKNGYISKGNSQLSGSLDVSGSVSASLGANTVGFYGTSSWAVSASWAPGATPTNPGGSNTQIQFNSASVFSGSSNLTFDYTNNNLLLTGSVLLSGSASITGVNYIDFLTTANPTHQEGRVHWTDDTKTIQVDTDVNNFMIELGHQSVIRVRNENSFTVAKGKIVRLVGESGNRPLIATASWTGDATSAATIGWVAAAIGSNNNGYVITNGILRGIDTSLYTPGTMLYLSSSGDWTSTPPDAPLHEVRLGQVIIQGNSTTGIVYVNIMNGYELTELHDVKTTTYSDGDLLIQSSSLWINSKQLTGSYGLTGSLIVSNSLNIIGTTTLTGSLNSSGSNTFIGNQTVTGSLFTTGSNTLIGNTILSGSIGISGSSTIQGTTTMTGSLNITGSTTQVGNNTLQGNTLLSGSIIISGSTNPGSPTASVQIYGDIRQSGYHRFDPVTTNIDTSISASYIYVSGSTNDLYFSQNGAGYTNTTRLRWLEGNLYTGLLNGGIVSQVNSNTYQISSGSGIIVDLNVTYNDNPYPVVEYLNWGNLTETIDALSGSFDQQFVAVSSSAGTAVIKAQGTPYVDGDYNNFIPIGIVLHQNRTSINGVQTFPGVAYGWKQRSFDFIKAFGALKISGYTLTPSGSSTRGLLLSGGTSWVDGRNYSVDPNTPSYIVEATGVTTSKIFRYYQSGSNWQSNWGYNTNGGAGFTDIDPTQYSNAGTLTPVPVLNWTIQRVFYFPNSATKALFVYYGNAVYANEADALAAVTTETFTEAPNTAASAIYVGYMLLRHNADFTVPASYEFYAAGLFRGSGTGGGGGGGASTLAGLSDVLLSSLANGDLLAYNGTTSLWNNTKTLSGSYILSGSLTTNDGVSVINLTASGSINAYDSNLSASISSSARKLYDIGGDPSIDWANRVLYDDTGTEVRVNWSDNTFNGSEALSLYDTGQIKSITWNTRQLFDGAGNQAINYSDLTTSNGVRVYGTSSYALTASYVNGMITKNNAVAGGTFAGNPKKATVTFSTPFPNVSYSIVVTGEDARSWTIESKVSGSFVINSNSNTALANSVYWQAISYGEFKQ